MKLKTSVLVLSALLCSAAQSAHAVPTTIADTYYGGTPTNPSFTNKDIVGETEFFDMRHMTVDVSGGILSIRINSSYFDNVGIRGTEIGDLFISSNGWNPFGAAPYINDNYITGEQWEYAISLDNHGEAAAASKKPTSFNGASGDAALYQIQSPSEIELSSAAIAGAAYREGQEVQFNAGPNNNALAFGTWSIGLLELDGYSDLLITMSLIGTPLEFINDLAFHFAMTCGNDVIEGQVPEPASMALLGAACGLYGIKRRRQLKKA